VTELDPWADERPPDPLEAEAPPWGVALLVGIALLPLREVLPAVILTGLGLVAPAAVAVLAGGSPFVAGAIVAMPAAAFGVIAAVIQWGPVGLLMLAPAGLFLGFSGLMGSAGAFAIRSWFDRRSADPETRARGRRGLIIIAVGALLIGGPAAASAYSDQRADARAEAVERRLLIVTRASVPFDGFLFAREPANPISSAVPGVHIIGTGVGANMQAEVGWGLSTRCVMVQVQDTSVTSHIENEACGPLVGG
jgi:hypothetical protein